MKSISSLTRDSTTVAFEIIRADPNHGEAPISTGAYDDLGKESIVAGTVHGLVEASIDNRDEASTTVWED